MKVYADYEWYISEYRNSETAVLNAAVFTFYARKATQEIRRYTGANIPEDDIPAAAKMCCCEVAELLGIYDQSKAGKGVSSESVGDLSVSYESTETTNQVLITKIKNTVYSWLSGTGLLYRGR